MTWPWVSRAHLDAVERSHASTVEFWKERSLVSEREVATYKSVNEQLFVELKAAQERYVATVERVAFPPVTVTPDIPRQPSVPSVVAQTIKDESGGDPRLAAWFRKRASELRAEGKTPEEIAAQLGTWQSTEEETAA